VRQEHWSTTCRHKQKHWTQFLCVSHATGQRTPQQIFIREQCLSCGDSIRQSSKRKHPEWENYPEFDYELRERIKNERWRGIISAPPVEELDEGFDYREYLQSTEWKNLRKLVFKRCNNVCEGCGTAPTRQVHHLTYARIGNEFLFDLVGVCAPCHRRIHE